MVYLPIAGDKAIFRQSGQFAATGNLPAFLQAFLRDERFVIFPKG